MGNYTKPNSFFLIAQESARKNGWVLYFALLSNQNTLWDVNKCNFVQREKKLVE